MTNCLFAIDQLRHLAVNAQRQILLGDLSAQFCFDVVENASGIGLKPPEGGTPVATELTAPAILCPLSLGSRRSVTASQVARSAINVVFSLALRTLFSVLLAIFLLFPFSSFSLSFARHVDVRSLSVPL